MKTNPITIGTLISAPVEKVWDFWVEPAHIMRWAFASSDWECPHAENDLQVGHQFLTRMAAKDGSYSFDIVGTYTALQVQHLIGYDMADGRSVSVIFESVPEGTKVTQSFDPESQNSRELQESGWQSILNNFKHYVENGRSLF